MPIFSEIILLLIRQNTIPYGQRHINAFDHMEFCLVISLTKGGNWANPLPPIFATGYVNFATSLYTRQQVLATFKKSSFLPLLLLDPLIRSFGGIIFGTYLYGTF